MNRRRRPCGWPVVLASILFCAVAKSEPSPEQPEWNQTDSTAPSQGAIQSADSSTASQASTDNVPLSSTGQAQAVPDATLNAQNTVSTDAPPAAAPEIGVPNANNYDLPWFNEYGKTFFERNGLKFRAGPVSLRLSLRTELEHSDNIYGTNTNLVSDNILHISPTLTVGAGDYQGKDGDYLGLFYHPSFDYYQTQNKQDRVNQNLDVTGQLTLSRYSTKVDLSYVTSSTPNATQSGGEGYGTLNFNWDNRYYLGAKTFTRAAVGAIIQNSDQNAYQTFSLSPQLGYTYSPKTTFSVGPSFGIAYLGEGATQTFQGLNVSVEYSNLQKLSFQGSFGVQARQFNGLDSTGAKNFITPVFNLNVVYAVSVNTSANLSLVRDVQLSDFERGLTYTTTSIGVGASKRIFERLSIGVSIGYQSLEYQGDSTIGRNDQYITFNPSLGYGFWRDNAASISIFYRYQRRTSDMGTFEYTINSYGFGVSYSF